MPTKENSKIIKLDVIELAIHLQQLLKKNDTYARSKKVFLCLWKSIHLFPGLRLFVMVWNNHTLSAPGSRVLSNQTRKQNNWKVWGGKYGAHQECCSTQRSQVCISKPEMKMRLRSGQAKSLGSPQVTGHSQCQLPYCNSSKVQSSPESFSPSQHSGLTAECYNSWNSKDHHLSDLIWSHSMINKFNKITNWQTVCNKCYFLDNKMDNVHSATYARNYWKQM